MATEADWFRVIDEHTRSIGPRPSIGLQLVEQALAEHPRSCRLWNRRGDLIQLLEDDVPSYSLADARMSYENACALDPLDPEAYESLGYFFDAVDEHLDDAERMFRKAIALGAGPSSWAGLARVLAELGRRDEALQLLAPGVCPFAIVETIDEMRFEINEGRWNPKPGARFRRSQS